MSEQIVKQRQLDPAYWIVHDNRFGKKVYLYQKPNQSIIIPTHEEIHEFESYREAQKAEKAQQTEDSFNLRTKPPTNLTKAKKIYEQKKLKQEQMSFKKIKTAIHRDVVPSIISDEVFTECFSCFDKNHELTLLRQQKTKLASQYQENKQKLKKYIAQLQKSNRQLIQQNQKLKKQISQEKMQEKLEEMMQKLSRLSPKSSKQSQISHHTYSSNPESPRKAVKSFLTETVVPSSQICEVDSSESRIITTSDDQSQT